jgi:DNA-binding helix-hairpin-helix protein with protein kinase domain
VSTITAELPVQQVVWSAAGRSHALGPEIARGGEGTIHPLGSGLAKIYRPSAIRDPGRRSELREKIAALCRIAPLQRDIRFAVPAVGLFADSSCTQWIGFAMRRCPGASLHALGSLVSLERTFPGWNRLHIARVAAAVVDGVAELQAHGVVVADINPGNFLAHTSGRVSFIDCDSYQVRSAKSTWLSRVFTPRYTAPEVLDQPFARPRSPTELSFAVGILLFELLTHGIHPYAVKWGDDPVENLRGGRTFIGGARATGALPYEQFSRYGDLDRAVKYLCVKTFVDGHSSPQARPTLEDWKWALGEHIRSLQ